jgi:tetratricopeptide (TPR) repeat protein
MKKNLAVLLFLFGIVKGVCAASLEDYVYREKPGVNQGVILNGGGQYIVNFTGLDDVRFAEGGNNPGPLKLVLAKPGVRILRIYCQGAEAVVTRHHVYYNGTESTVEINVKPGKIYRVSAENVNGVFRFSVAEITPDTSQPSLEQYLSDRLGDERRASEIPRDFSLDAIFFRLSADFPVNRMQLMSWTVFNAGDSAIYLFAQAMFASDAEERARGLERVLRKDAGFWIADYELGKIALAQGQYGELLAHMAEVSRLNPECALAYLYQGYALTKLNRGTEAATAFGKSAELGNPGAKLIMARLAHDTPDQIFDQYNRPLQNSWGSVIYGNMALAKHADARLASQPESDFGLSLTSDTVQWGLEFGNIGVTVTDAALKSYYSDEVYEAGTSFKYRIPLGNRFLVSLGAEYSLLNIYGLSSLSLFNPSVKFMAGGEFFLARNLSLGLDLGYRQAQLTFEKDDYVASGVWDSQITEVKTYEHVDLSGVYGQLGLKWYSW